MKKTVQVTLAARAAIPQRRVAKEVVVCDICNQPVKVELYGGGGGKCHLCGRDMCSNHTVREYDGDYGTKYCSVCHPLYIPELENLKNQHDKEIEALERRIKKTSLAQPPLTDNKKR